MYVLGHIWNAQWVSLWACPPFWTSKVLGKNPQVPFTFATASLIAERLSASNPARCKVVSNEFKSILGPTVLRTDVGL